MSEQRAKYATRGDKGAAGKSGKSRRETDTLKLLDRFKSKLFTGSDRKSGKGGASTASETQQQQQQQQQQPERILDPNSLLSDDDDDDDDGDWWVQIALPAVWQTPCAQTLSSHLFNSPFSF